MKKLFALSVLFTAAAFADSFTGTLMDSNCKDKDAADHTAKCAIACAKSGFGVKTADGKYLKLDEAGNAKALAALKATDKTKDLKTTVTGTLDGDTIKTEAVSLD